MADWTIPNLTTAVNGAPEVWEIEFVQGATPGTMTITQGTVNIGNISLPNLKMTTLEPSVNHWQIGRPTKGQLYPRFNK